MANLDSIATGKLLQTDECSVYEAVAHLMLYNRILSRQRLFDTLSKSFPGKIDDSELHLAIDRVGKVGSIWSIFRTIESITDILEHINNKLIRVSGANGATHHASEEDWHYWDYMQAAHDEDKGIDDRAVVKDGIVCYAAMKWYIVRVRHLISKVAADKSEVDWFWKTFGEHHHVNLIDFRNQLVHMVRPKEYTPNKLTEQSDWFVGWMNSIARMVRRTSISIPDPTGKYEHSFRTAEISALPKTEDREQLSASNALVTITMELDPTSNHPCEFGFISFDPDTNRLTAHDGITFGYIALHC